MGYGHVPPGRWVHGPPIRNTCGPPHGRGWLGSGSSRTTACTPGLHTQHAAPGTSRGGLCRRGCPTKPYFSRRPRGGPHIFYMADELILERFGLRHTNTWGIHHVIWLTNICIFPKVDRWGRILYTRKGSESVREAGEVEFSYLHKDQLFAFNLGEVFSVAP